MTKTRDCRSGPERSLHRLKEGLPKTAVLTTSEPRTETRRAGTSRYRGDERQLFQAARREEPWNTHFVSHP